MVTEKLHGLQATSISLNDRFTMLLKVAPQRFQRARTPQRRTNFGPFINQNSNIANNQNIIEQIARKLQQHARRQAVKQRLGMVRHFGSESNLSGLRRYNSFGSLNHINNRLNWRKSNNNLNRSASFNNLSQGWQERNFRRRGGRAIAIRGKLRGGGRMQFGPWFGSNVGRVRGGGAGVRRTLRGRGRGGALRNQGQQKTVPTKEELDAQLDQYMASTKSALDAELDAYMKSAIDLE